MRHTFLMGLVMAVAAYAGSFTDSRDGQVYRTIKIGDQTWMSQNLNYASRQSYCFRDEPSNCDEQGRLYKWQAAIDVCPDGWHLPQKWEFNALLNYVGGIEEGGKKLKSSRGWLNGGNGDDEYGFKLKPYGNRNPQGEYVNLGTAAYLWASDDAGDNGYVFFALDNYDVSDVIELDKNMAFSVRCVEGYAHDYEEYEEDFDYDAIDEEESYSFGSVTDNRDGQTYRTVVIGEQEWMADNLNFKINDKSQSWCYENKESNCRTYGRLYTWSAVMARPEAKCGMGKKCEGLRNQHRGLCPENFHVPTKMEWMKLINYVGGNDVAARNLIEGGAWNVDFEAPNGYGFSALPAGDYLKDKGFVNQGALAFFWTATEADKNHGTEMFFYNTMILSVDNAKDAAFSLRCVRN